MSVSAYTSDELAPSILTSQWAFLYVKYIHPPELPVGATGKINLKTFSTHESLLAILDEWAHPECHIKTSSTELDHWCMVWEAIPRWSGEGIFWVKQTTYFNAGLIALGAEPYPLNGHELRKAKND